MIRTPILRCELPRHVCNALNRESGRVYTGVCVYHWRVYRKKGIRLRSGAAEKISDFFLGKTGLHAHSADAAQQGFYYACTATREARRGGMKDARFPYRRKRFRTTVWKNTAIRYKEGVLMLSNGRANRRIEIRLPDFLRDALRFAEVRLVYDRKARSYFWHVVVENGRQPAQAGGDNIVSVDLGEVHPAVVGDEEESVLITCRELRHEKQGHDKRLASLNKAISRTRNGSRRHKRLCRARNRLKGKHKRVVRDMEHKISRAIVDVAVERKACVIVIGDVRKTADGVNLSAKANQKISQWDHGQIRKLAEYKAEAEGIRVVLVPEYYTSQTCPACRERHKPGGRVYLCPACAFRSHRDVVGQINILSVYKYGEPGKIPAPSVIKHRIPHNLRVMRRRRDTGRGLATVPVACGFSTQEAASLQ